MSQRTAGFSAAIRALPITRWDSAGDLDFPWAGECSCGRSGRHPNEVVIGEGEEVFSRTLEADGVNYMAVPEPAVGESIRCRAKIRYGHRGAACTVTRTDTDRIRCDFDEPVRAATPGQAVVFYQGDFVAGGGTIL